MTQVISRRALLAALPATACLAAGEPTAKSTYAVIVFTRHAEKGDDDPSDPDLSKAGAARALRLADVLAPSSATRLLTSDKKRTRQTLAPLGERVGVDVNSLPAADLNAWIAALSNPDHPVTVVASHSNVIPALIAAFGAKLTKLDEHGNIPESEYGRLVVMTLNSEAKPVVAASVLELMLP